MNTNSNGSGHISGNEPELTGTKAAIEKELVFLELKDEVRTRLELPSHVPILRTDVAEAEKRGGDIPVAAFAAGVEALKLLQPGASGYDRFLARYYLLEGERNLQEATRDLYQAQRYLQKSLDLEQDTISAEAAYYLATVVQPDDPELAVNLYRRSIELNPNAATPHFELGILLRERRDLSAALDEFEAAFKLDPTSANLLNEVGDTHIQAGDWNKAVASFRRAVELEPDYWALPVKLGMAEFRNGENAAAIRDLRSGLDNAPDELSDNYDMQMYVEGLYYLALAYAEIGRPDQSRKLYRAILEIDPAHQGAIAGLAQG